MGPVVITIHLVAAAAGLPTLLRVWWWPVDSENWNLIVILYSTDLGLYAPHAQGQSKLDDEGEVQKVSGLLLLLIMHLLEGAGRYY